MVLGADRGMRYFEIPSMVFEDRRSGKPDIRFHVDGRFELAAVLSVDLPD